MPAASVESEFGRELQSPSAAAGLRRGFSPARPPGLGGGHCALGLVDAVAHDTCGGSAVQGYKAYSPGEPTVLVASQRFRSRAFVGVEQSSRLEQFAAVGVTVEKRSAIPIGISLVMLIGGRHLCDVVQADRDVVQPLPDPREIQV